MFADIRHYSYEQWLAKRGRWGEPIVEFTVSYAIPDIAIFVTRSKAGQAVSRSPSSTRKLVGPRDQLKRASFSMITCVAALHHLNPTAALAAMRQLLVPGGCLVIVGLARRFPLHIMAWWLIGAPGDGRCRKGARPWRQI